MQFHYTIRRSPVPVVTLGGRFGRPAPLIHASLVGPAATVTRRVLLDTGSDDTVFPESVAKLAGIDLSGAPTGMGTGIGRVSLPLRYVQVVLRISDGHEYREWPAWVGFAPARLVDPILGFAGCLQFFDADFRGGREEVELAVNPLYPGT